MGINRNVIDSNKGGSSNVQVMYPFTIIIFTIRMNVTLNRKPLGVPLG